MAIAFVAATALIAPPAPAGSGPAAGVETAAATPEVTVELLRERLRPHGEIVRIAGRGEAWKPRDPGPDWQPFSRGRWIFNERVGWTFLAEEPWAEITGHYGRWVRDPGQGWVWLPGTEWAPAWVEWRRSRRHVGWRPLPPEDAHPPAIAANSRDSGKVERKGRGTVKAASPAPARPDPGEGWVFVPIESVLAERIAEVRVPLERRAAIYDETRPIGRVERHRGLVLNFALQPEIIRRETDRIVPSRNLPRPEMAPLPPSLRDVATEPRPPAQPASE